MLNVKELFESLSDAEKEELKKLLLHHTDDVDVQSSKEDTFANAEIIDPLQQNEEVTVGDQLDQIVNEAESEVDVSATLAAQEIKERADEAARLAEQRAREETVRAAKKLAAEKAAAESAAKQAAEEERKRAEHAKRIAMRQAPVEKAANKLKDKFKF